MARSALAVWLDRTQTTLSDLMFEARLSWTTVSRARDGKNVRLATARKLSKATRGAVPVSALTKDPRASEFADGDDDPRAVA